MNNKDMTLEEFRSEILSQTSYNITDAELEDFYEEGETVFDVLDWCEFMFDRELFS